MDTVLTTGLVAVGLKDDHDITRNFPGDCLFLCFVEAVRKAENEGGLIKSVGVTWSDGKAMVPHPNPVATEDATKEDEHVNIVTVKGLREIAAACAEKMSKGHVKAELLRRYINNRFSSATARKEDAKLDDYEPPADDASDTDRMQAWCKLMMWGGVFRISTLSSTTNIARILIPCVTWYWLFRLGRCGRHTGTCGIFGTGRVPVRGT